MSWQERGAAWAVNEDPFQGGLHCAAHQLGRRSSHLLVVSMQDLETAWLHTLLMSSKPFHSQPGSDKPWGWLLLCTDSCRALSASSSQWVGFLRWALRYKYNVFTVT